MAQPVYAQPVLPPFDGGKGTEKDPFLIRLDSHLAVINDLEWREYHFKQTADISLAAYGDKWQSIGSADYDFSGSYDGDDYKISDLIINDSNADNVGLFGFTEAGSLIKNVNVSFYSDNLDFDIVGRYNFNSLVGFASRGVKSSYFFHPVQREY